MTVRQSIGVGVAIAILLVILLVTVIVRTAPVRGAVRAYTMIVESARVGDLAQVRSLCSEHYLKTHVLKEAGEEGVAGIPRNINKNFKAWREGESVWLCPTNRVGPVYQFVSEGGAWKFDGPVGLLMTNGQVDRMTEGLQVE